MRNRRRRLFTSKLAIQVQLKVLYMEHHQQLTNLPESFGVLDGTQSIEPCLIV